MTGAFVIVLLVALIAALLAALMVVPLARWLDTIGRTGQEDGP